MIGRAGTSVFHPELRRYARFLPRTLVTPLTVKVFRAAGVRQTNRATAGVEVVTLESGVQVRVHRPPGPASGSGLLWMHGGGYVLGHAGMDDALCRRLARRLRTTVIAVDYRLAPAHPYPIPLHDCYDALRWMTDQPGFDSARIAVAGASAGGGLAAALALLARDRQEIRLAAQVLIYPMLDDRSAYRHDPHPRHRRLWSNASSRLGWRAYLGDTDPVTAVPARQADLSELAPAWIGVGTLDVLHAESVAYAHRLRAAGVPCELEVVPGAFHGFDAVAGQTAVAQAFFASQCESLRRALAAD